MKYLLNIKTGTIHDGSAYCPRINRMAEFNKKWFDKYEDAVNYYSGKEKKGCPCGICLKDKK